MDHARDGRDTDDHSSPTINNVISGGPFE